MKEIRISVKNKIAMNPGNATYVCDNSDYRVIFDFDAEWDEHPVKTARFKYNGMYQEVVFTGNECPVPLIQDARLISIGVYAGNLQASTPAVIHASQSILSGDEAHEEPAEDVYNKLVELVESGVLQGPGGKSAYELAVENGYSGSETDWLASLHGAPGKTPVFGVDYGTPEQTAEIAGKAAEILADDIKKISDGKVDKVEGKGLSTNDYDNAAKAKVDAIPEDPKYTDTVYDDTEVKQGLNHLKDDLTHKVGYSEVVGNQLLMYSDSTKEHLLATLDLPGGGVSDVRVAGASVVQDGIANVPIAANGNIGVVSISKYGTHGIRAGSYGGAGGLSIQNASTYDIDKRISVFLPVTPNVLDYAVKAAMTDGKGAAWTAKEQAAARERIGIHKVTQAEYDALTDTSGIYIIVEE